MVGILIVRCYNGERTDEIPKNGGMNNVEVQRSREFDATPYNSLCW